jgi:hypothetical protein
MSLFIVIIWAVVWKYTSSIKTSRISSLILIVVVVSWAILLAVVWNMHITTMSPLNIFIWQNSVLTAILMPLSHRWLKGTFLTFATDVIHLVWYYDLVLLVDGHIHRLNSGWKCMLIVYSGLKRLCSLVKGWLLHYSMHAPTLLKVNRPSH